MTRVDVLSEQVSIACRVLAREGLVSGVLGHVSARVSETRIVVRCRGPEERGLRRTTIDDVWQVTPDGAPVDLPAGFRTPNELAIHTELMKRRPAVGAVVHAHPPAALLCGLAGLDPRAVLGAYNIPAMRLAAEGVPVYPRPVLITRPELAAEMIDAMCHSDVCLMLGHGITVAAATVEQAVVRAIDLNVLMSVTVELARLGASVPTVSEVDLEELPDLGSEFNSGLTWRSLVAELEAEDRRAPGGA